jgi:hypothetical protein
MAIPLLLLQISLALSPAPGISPAAIDAAVGEATALWSRYAVAIVPAGDESDPAAIRLSVVFDRWSAGGPSPRPGFADSPWAGALGAVVFDRDAQPRSVITVFMDAVLILVERARVFGTAERAWPPLLRQRVIGRMLGRVIAHEVGHYLFRSEQHTRDGLMRARFRSDDLAAESRTGFALTHADAARVASLDTDGQLASHHESAK